MSLIYNATFDKNTRKLSFEDRAGNEIYSFTVPERGPAVDDITKPLTFKATQNGSTVTLKKNGSPVGDFQTSTDGGNTWSDYTLDTAIALNTGDEVYFRAKSDRTSAQSFDAYFYFEMTGKIEAWHNVMSLYRTNDFATYNTVVSRAFTNLFQNCTSLTKAPVLPATTLGDYCYQYMFNGCASLTKAPELPATTLTQWCYHDMFRGCTSLTEAPVLPATTLATNCYGFMFSGCTSLTEAPVLPATTLTEYCYFSMFEGCTSLTEAPVLPATTLADDCYYHMFNGCTSLTKAPELPATTLADGCYWEMFKGCTSLTKAPVLPATTLSTNCYGCMFEGCASLTETPELPATTLATTCYWEMFKGCSSLNEVRCKISSAYSSSDISKYAKNWLEGVASAGTFYTNADAKWPSGASGIPTGWTRVNERAKDDITKPLTFRATQDGSTVKLKKSNAPSGDFQTSRDGGNTWTDYTLNTAITLNTGEEVSFRAKANRSAQATYDYFYFSMTGKIEAWHNVMSMIRTNDFATYDTVVGHAFRGLFNGCTSLTKAPVLPATTLANYCYYHMFDGCTSLTKAPVLPATTLYGDCYRDMFNGCTSLIKAPELPATTLATNCYGFMFSGCTSLTEAPELPVTTLANYCYYYMFNDCTSLTKAPVLPATTLTNNCYNGMFSGCTSLTKAPELPATTLTDYCYNDMFSRCTSLTKAPVLPATTLGDYCYQSMFYGCSSLNEVRCQMPSSYSSSDIGSNYTKNWLEGVASTGTFYTNADADWPSGSVSGIPTGWTRTNT